jgi:hypothetical protein
MRFNPSSRAMTLGGEPLPRQGSTLTTWLRSERWLDAAPSAASAGAPVAYTTLDAFGLAAAVFAREAPRERGGTGLP